MWLPVVAAFVIAHLDVRMRVDAEIAYQPHVFGVSPYWVPGVSANAVWDWFEVGGGLRVFTAEGGANVAVAGFARVLLYAPAGVWRPAAGLEIEVGSARNAPSEQDPVGSLQSTYGANNARNLAQVAVVIAPVRLQFGDLFISALVLRAGTPLAADAGRRVVLSLTFANIGWTL